MKLRLLGPLVLGALLAVASVAGAETLTEDFETFAPGTDPDRNWYDFKDTTDENFDVANASNTSMIIGGNKSLFARAPASLENQTRSASFELGVPKQVDSLNFTIQAQPPANHSNGTRQVVKIDSRNPRRTMVEFYVFCDDPSNASACEFRVRFNHIDTTGQTLINETQNRTRFTVKVVPDWREGEYRLFVNGVDDGVFPFLELPQNVADLEIRQQRRDVALNATVDNLTLEGAVNATPAKRGGDVAEGLRNFAEDINFTSQGSEFFLGLLFFLIIMAGVIVPLIALSQDNTLVGSLSFFAVLLSLWLIDLGFWPDWIGIGLIILSSAVAAETVRQLALGVKDASAGPSLVLGSLGYFVIASSFLGFSGYATETITIPEKPVEQTKQNGSEVQETQSFAGAVTECIFSGGVFTYGLLGDCSQETQTETFKAITDAAGNVFGWVQASVDFVFQLLTFSFPIPTVFNVAIVAPPAMALAAYAVEVIRGS